MKNLQELASLVAPALQALADGKTVQTREHAGSGVFSKWYDVSYSRMGDTNKDLIERLTWELMNRWEWRIKPEPVWRPWTKAEIPAVFVVRNMGTRGTFVCTRAAIETNHDALIHFNSPSFKGYSVRDLLDFWWHVKEDGTELRCGVIEEPK